MTPEKFWSMTRREGDCLIWTGRLNRDGYGETVWIRGHLRQQTTHRAAYILAYGPIPEGMTVDHICFTRSCVRPEHLRLLTAQENARRQRRAFKTVCINGHPLDEENTYWRPTEGRGRRDCRACGRERVRRYKARRKAS